MVGSFLCNKDRNQSEPQMETCPPFASSITFLDVTWSAKQTPVTCYYYGSPDELLFSEELSLLPLFPFACAQLKWEWTWRQIEKQEMLVSKYAKDVKLLLLLRRMTMFMDVSKPCGFWSVQEVRRTCKSQQVTSVEVEAFTRSREGCVHGCR